MEQQDPNQGVSTLQGVLDLLTDDERKELAAFIQNNLDNLEPEQIRKEKQAAATTAARAGMTPAAPRTKAAPPPSPQQTRQEKQAAAAAAARAGMTPAAPKTQSSSTSDSQPSGTVARPEDILSPEDLEFWKNISGDSESLQRILKDPKLIKFLVRDQEFWKQVIPDTQFWEQVTVLSGQPPSEPVPTSDFSQDGYGDTTTNVPRGIPSVPRDPLAGLRSASKDPVSNKPKATPDFSRSRYGDVKTNVPAGIPSVPKVPTSEKSKTTKKRSTSKKRNT